VLDHFCASDSALAADCASVINANNELYDQAKSFQSFKSEPLGYAVQFFSRHGIHSHYLTDIIRVLKVNPNAVSDLSTAVSPKFHGSSFLVASSSNPRNKSDVPNFLITC